MGETPSKPVKENDLKKNQNNTTSDLSDTQSDSNSIQHRDIDSSEKENTNSDIDPLLQELLDQPTFEPFIPSSSRTDIKSWFSLQSQTNLESSLSHQKVTLNHISPLPFLRMARDYQWFLHKWAQNVCLEGQITQMDPVFAYSLQFLHNTAQKSRILNQFAISEFKAFYEVSHQLNLIPLNNSTLEPKLEKLNQKISNIFREIDELEAMLPDSLKLPPFSLNSQQRRRTKAILESYQQLDSPPNLEKTH